MCLDLLISKSCSFLTPLFCSYYKSIVLSGGLPAGKGVEGGDQCGEDGLILPTLLSFESNPQLTGLRLQKRQAVISDQLLPTEDRSRVDGWLIKIMFEGRGIL